MEGNSKVNLLTDSALIPNKKYDFLIVGAGLSGAVLAERLATQKGKTSLVIDKRDHIGGNCFDYVDENGILMNKYGAHLFHTNHEDVWKYINSFKGVTWRRWEHQVIANVDNKLVCVPPNITTVNVICGENIRTQEEADKWLKSVQVPCENPSNSKEIALSRVGEVLYEKIFRHYTKKQWDKYPEELDASVMARIPVRNNFDTRYFDDRYQVLPQEGYTAFFEAILAHPLIDVCINCDFFKIKEKLSYGQLVYTGPIDAYFSSAGFDPLEYRSIEFHVERLKNTKYFQPASVVNYPGKEVPYTRIVEYKHFLNQQSPHTTIVRETTSDSGEPYYPVPNKENQEKYEKYRVLAEKEAENGVHFIGRLANYKYFNMDQAIKNSLDYFAAKSFEN